MLVLKGPAPNLDPGPFSCFQNCPNTKYVFHSKFQNPNHPILNMRSNFKTLVPQFIRMKIWTPIHSYIFQFIRISSPPKKNWGAIHAYIFPIHSYVLRTQSSEGGRVMLSSKRTTAEYPPGKSRRPWTSSVPGWRCHTATAEVQNRMFRSTGARKPLTWSAKKRWVRNSLTTKQSEPSGTRALCLTETIPFNGSTSLLRLVPAIASANKTFILTFYLACLQQISLESLADALLRFYLEST